MSLVALDLETTGADPDTAKIVEIGMVRYEADGAIGWSYDRRINPGMPIPAEATAVHGITDADVAAEVQFAGIASFVQEMLPRGTMLLTYNGRAFDAVILDRELRAAGQPGLGLDDGGVKEIDLYRVWTRLEPRTLEGALRRYGSYALEEAAHGALADAQAVGRLITAMREVHSLTVYELVSLSKPEDEIDRAGKLRRREDGVVVFAFGKLQGKPIAEHPDYVDWMLAKDFPADTKRWLRELVP